MSELGEFVKHNEDLRAMDVQVLAVSVDPPDKSHGAQEKSNATFPFLSDSKGEVMELYGTRSPEHHNREGISINTPTLVLIDRTGTIRWIHQATNFRVRESIEEDLAQARKLK
jgi:peroxiredoxin